MQDYDRFISPLTHLPCLGLQFVIMAMTTPALLENTFIFETEY